MDQWDDPMATPTNVQQQHEDNTFRGTRTGGRNQVGLLRTTERAHRESGPRSWAGEESQPSSTTLGGLRDGVNFFEIDCICLYIIIFLLDPILL